MKREMHSRRTEREDWRREREGLGVMGGWMVLVGVCLYVCVVLALGWLRPGYDHLARLVSELGERGTAYGGLLNLVLVLDGIALIFFALGLRSNLQPSRWRWWGSLCLFLFGAGVIAGGIFPCDVGCVSPKTFSGWMHGLLGLPAGIASIAAPLVFAAAFARDPRWTPMVLMSRVMGVVGIILLISSILIFPGIGWTGLGQRLALIVQLGWPVWTAMYLLRLIIVERKAHNNRSIAIAAKTPL